MDGYPADIVIVNNSGIDGLKRSCRVASVLIAGTDKFEFDYGFESLWVCQKSKSFDLLFLFPL